MLLLSGAWARPAQNPPGAKGNPRDVSEEGWPETKELRSADPGGWAVSGPGGAESVHGERLQGQVPGGGPQGPSGQCDP